MPELVKIAKELSLYLQEEYLIERTVGEIILVLMRFGDQKKDLAVYAGIGFLEGHFKLDRLVVGLSDFFAEEE